MIKLEVEMYVRIKNKAGWCCIGKIYNINDFREPSMKYCIDIQGDDFVFVAEDMIMKASHNIIDLIEVGDYVNGMRVDDIDIHSKRLYREMRYDYEIISEKEIKSIVTKEQFESMEYRLGE